MAAYTLRQVQDSMDVVSGSIVDPVLQLLKSLHIDLQQEGRYIYRCVLLWQELLLLLLLPLLLLLF